MVTKLSDITVDFLNAHFKKMWDAAYEKEDIFDRTLTALSCGSFILDVLREDKLDKSLFESVDEYLSAIEKYLHNLTDGDLSGYSLENIMLTLFPALLKYRISANAFLMLVGCSTGYKHVFECDIFDTAEECTSRDCFIEENLNDCVGACKEIERRQESFVHKFSSLTKLSESTPDKLCTICYEELLLEEDFLRLNCCRHLFHTHCAYRWFRENR